MIYDSFYITNTCNLFNFRKVYDTQKKPHQKTKQNKQTAQIYGKSNAYIFIRYYHLIINFTEGTFDTQSRKKTPFFGENYAYHTCVQKIK